MLYLAPSRIFYPMNFSFLRHLLTESSDYDIVLALNFHLIFYFYSYLIYTTPDKYLRFIQPARGVFILWMVFFFFNVCIPRRRRRMSFGWSLGCSCRFSAIVWLLFYAVYFVYSLISVFSIKRFVRKIIYCCF